MNCLVLEFFRLFSNRMRRSAWGMLEGKSGAKGI